MKLKPDKNQITWGVTLFLLFVACAVVYSFMFHSGVFLAFVRRILRIMSAVVYGVIIAYILNPLVNFLEEALIGPFLAARGVRIMEPGREKTRKQVRTLSLTISVIVFLLVLTALLLICIPQLFRSVARLIRSVPTYVNNVNVWITSLQSADNPYNETIHQLQVEFNKLSLEIMNYLNNTVMPNMTRILHRVTNYVSGFIATLLNLFIGLIVSIYLLYSKETFQGQGKKLIYALFHENTANEILSEIRHIHFTFSGFLVGKLIDSTIIGLICYVVTRIMGTPYAGLVSVMVGVTNIIPVFGPYIGGFIGVFFILIIDPLEALKFLIFVVILQQFDGNILGPKILGYSTGLSSFWVLFSILLFGGLFGIPGMILGAPLFAVFFRAGVRLINHLLRRKGLPVNAWDYTRAAYMEKGRLVDMEDATEGRFNTRKNRSPLSMNIRETFRKQEEEEEDSADSAPSGEEAEQADPEA